MSVQNTYVWELSHNFPWLDPAMAEVLRNDIEALRLLEQEHAQVCLLSIFALRRLVNLYKKLGQPEEVHLLSEPLHLIACLEYHP